MTADEASFASRGPLKLLLMEIDNLRNQKHPGHIPAAEPAAHAENSDAPERLATDSCCCSSSIADRLDRLEALLSPLKSTMERIVGLDAERAAQPDTVPSAPFAVSSTRGRGRVLAAPITVGNGSAESRSGVQDRLDRVKARQTAGSSAGSPPARGVQVAGRWDWPAPAPSRPVLRDIDSEYLSSFSGCVKSGPSASAAHTLTPRDDLVDVSVQTLPGLSSGSGGPFTPLNGDGVAAADWQQSIGVKERRNGTVRSSEATRRAAETGLSNAKERVMRGRRGSGLPTQAAPVSLQTFSDEPCNPAAAAVDAPGKDAAALLQLQLQVCQPSY